jgi:hypothetical protein
MGKQYVDSKGCVFIRAGIDGTVSWIPRIARSRQGVCGFRPTFAGAVTPPEPVQTAGVIQITNSTPPPASRAAPAAPPAPVAARVAPAPRPAPAPRVVRQVAQPPALIIEKTPAPVIVAQTVRSVLQGSVACTSLSPIAQQYSRSTEAPVRCGPQSQPIVGASVRSVGGNRQAAAAPVQVAPNTRIVPRHVAVNRVNTTNVQVPHGYKRVWEDGRLNANRAEQSLAGHQAMGLIWTSTVPRRLLNQADGTDVTASVALVYPYTDFARQQRELGQVTIIQRDGQTLKRIVRSVNGVVNPEPGQARVATVQRKPTYSSRSVAPKAAVTQARPKGEVAARGYVQVGRFNDADAAQQLARQVQRMGMPVRVGLHTVNGRTTRLVIAGPFGGEGEVNTAVNRLRSAGHKAVKR